MSAKHFIIAGHVQGVGFRFFVVRQAQALGLSGWVRNLPDGDVEAVAEGADDALAEFESALRRGPTMSRVDRVDVHPADAPSRGGFVTLPTP